MKPIEEDIEPYIATVAKLLREDNQIESFEILRIAKPRCEQTDYDNWNGGTYTYTIFLTVETEIYAQLGQKRTSIEEQIDRRFQEIVSPYTSDFFRTSIVPKIDTDSNWRDTSGNEVSRYNRQNIIDGLSIHNISWHGRLDEISFLSRIYDLEKLPSFDSRFTTASQDIWQHRVNNFDWEDDWVFTDKRFDLLSCKTEVFLRFLCETVHPVIRPDKSEAIKIVSHYNNQLRKDGWQLAEEELIAGQPRYVSKRLDSNTKSVNRAKSVADALDAGSMRREIERLERAIETDPALAIGTSKDLIESCCKTILKRCSIDYSNNDDLPALVKKVTKELKLVPDNISDEAKGAEKIKLILRNLAALTQYIAELRSLYGSGHGKDGKFTGLTPRHARLAAGTATVFIDFLTETFHERNIQDTNK